MNKRTIVAALAIAGFFVATYLFLYKIGKIGNLSCSIGSCETVNLSKWATLMGAPVAAWGVGFYVGLFGVSIVSLQDRYYDSVGLSKILVVVTGLGVLFSAWLTYLELFVIHAICQWCVISAIIVTIAFIVAVFDLRDRVAFQATE
ncbi:MAG TPA: vitamin K epoxide reductase family protein [Gemmatimonadaceae bacterium]|nr:vitamin K epoxide reductase family protein [Gemmatimonadaceae bacterium]